MRARLDTGKPKPCSYCQEPTMFERRTDDDKAYEPCCPQCGEQPALRKNAAA